MLWYYSCRIIEHLTVILLSSCSYSERFCLFSSHLWRTNCRGTSNQRDKTSPGLNRVKNRLFSQSVLCIKPLPKSTWESVVRQVWHYDAKETRQDLKAVRFLRMQTSYGAYGAQHQKAGKTAFHFISRATFCYWSSPSLFRFQVLQYSQPRTHLVDLSSFQDMLCCKCPHKSGRFIRKIKAEESDSSWSLLTVVRFFYHQFGRIEMQCSRTVFFFCSRLQQGNKMFLCYCKCFIWPLEKGLESVQ